MSVVFWKAFNATLHFNPTIFPQTPCLIYTWIEKNNLEQDSPPVLPMQYYHFEVMRSEKKLLSCSSTVNSLYSGHCRDLELLSSLARVHYGMNLFQSNISNLWEEPESGDPNLHPFSPSFLPSSLHPLPLSTPATQATFYGSEKVEKPSRFVMYSRHFKDSALIAV